MKYTILLAILMACDRHGTPVPTGKTEVPVLKAEVVVLVRNASGELVEGAGVAVEGLEGTVAPGAAMTDSEGRAAVQVDAGVETVLRITKPGYAAQVVRVFSTDSVVVPTALIERAEPVRIVEASAGGTAVGADGARVTLPANALVDGAGQPVSGAVDVFLTPIDITDDRAKDAFPGLYEEQGGDALLSYGCVDITFEQAGAELDLAPGVTATIEVPIYVTAQPDGTPIAAGDSIPLWSLDEATGIWRDEGMGTVVVSAASPEGWALRGTATHFTWWNCDFPLSLRRRKFNFKHNVSVFDASVFFRARVESGAGLGPRSYASRTVDSKVETEISLPTNFDVELVATAFDGWLRGTLNLAADDLSERIEMTLKPRTEFVPGERLRGQMTEVGERHVYGFEAFADEVFRANFYPAVDHTSGPVVSGSLGGTVLIKDPFGVELARALFDATGAAELEATLSDDGRYTIEIVADGKVPGWYMGTTSIAAPTRKFDLEFVYKIRGGDLFHVNLYKGLPELPVQLNPDRNGRRVFNFRAVPGGGVLYAFNRRTTPPDLYLADPANPGVATMLNRESEVPFGSFGVQLFEASPSDPTKVLYTVVYADSTGALYLVDTDEPGQSRQISDASLVSFHGRVDFKFVRRGESVVYRVVTGSGTAESFIVDIGNPSTPVAFNSPLAAGETIRTLTAGGGVSPTGVDFLYTAGDMTNRAELYTVQVFRPGSATRISNAITNVRVSSPTWFSNSLMVFFLANDGTNSVNELFLVQPRLPGDVKKVNAPVKGSINSYGVSLTGNHAAYINDSKLQFVDLLNLGVSTVVPGVVSPGQFAFTPDGTYLVVRDRDPGTGNPRIALVDASEPTNITQLLPPTATGLAESDLTLTPDGNGIVVHGDLNGSGKNALFVISFDRPGIAVEVSGDLGGGEIERFEVR